MILSGLDIIGKALLLKSIVSNKTGLKVAIIVEEINYEWFGNSFQEDELQIEEEFVRFKNGCYVVIADEAADEIIKLSKDGGFDHIIITCEGITEPIAIAETFTFEISERFGKKKFKQMVKNHGNCGKRDQIRVVC